MKPGFIAGAGLCALVTAAVHAEPTPPRPLAGGHGNHIDAFVAQHDANADGRLTREEFDTFRRQRYDATDANGDGTVDVEEYVQEFEDRMRAQREQGRGARIAQTKTRFATLDADQDGKMTFAEYQLSGKRTFDTSDRNRDGTVDAADAKLPPPR